MEAYRNSSNTKRKGEKSVSFHPDYDPNMSGSQKDPMSRPSMHRDRGSVDGAKNMSFTNYSTDSRLHLNKSVSVSKKPVAHIHDCSPPKEKVKTINVGLKRHARSN